MKKKKKPEMLTASSLFSLGELSPETTGIDLGGPDRMVLRPMAEVLEAVKAAEREEEDKALFADVDPDFNFMEDLKNI